MTPCWCFDHGGGLQDPWFWEHLPVPCDPQDLPGRGQTQHELAVKRRRQEQKEAAVGIHDTWHGLLGYPDMLAVLHLQSA